jgi:hypothetical protein
MGGKMFHALSLSRDEKGQSLVEASVGLIFLLLLILVVFEGGIMFSTYMALIDAGRDGAKYASSCGRECDPDSSEYSIEKYNKYEGIIRNTALSSWLTDPSKLIIIPPEIVDNFPPEHDEVLVRVTYRVETFTSSISLPYFGRMGLPYYWPLTYEARWPVKLKD